MEDSAFRGCPGVNERNIDFSRIASVESSAFSGCVNIHGAVSLDRLVSISSAAFYGCTGITAVNFSESLESIGSSAFYGCSGLTSVRTPVSLTSLGSSAFGGCSQLEYAEINGAGLSLKNSSTLFEGCAGLRRVRFGDGVTALRGNGYSSASGSFAGCTNLVEISVGTGVTEVPAYFLSADSRDKQPNPGKVTFEGEISNVGSGSLNRSSITNLEIRLAAGCTVEDSAFRGCPAVTLDSVDFAQIGSMGESAFLDCTNIVGYVSLPLLQLVGRSAFLRCVGITSVEFGSGLTSIGQSAFYSCMNAQSFAFSSVPPSVGRDAFSAVKSGAIGTFIAAHAAEWEAVIDSKGYWNGLKMKPSYYTVIYDANNGTGARTTATVEWGEPTLAGDGTFTWEAHYFMGWAFAPDSGSSLGSDDVIPEPQEGNTVTLFGQWATFEPVAADWGTGSITLKATGVNLKEGEDFFLSFCDAATADSDGAQWEYVDDFGKTVDGNSVSVTDSQYSSRLGGIPAVRYRLQIGKSKEDVRATPLSCTTRTKHGIFVGIDRYSADYQNYLLKTRGAKLTEPENPECHPGADYATLFATLFKDEDKGGVSEENCKVLIDADATYKKLNDAFVSVRLDKNGNKKIKPGDVFVLYIATHGNVVHGSTTTGELALYDKPPFNGADCYREEMLMNQIKSLDPEQNGVATICILSACHSGAFFDNSNEAECNHSEWCQNQGLNPANIAWITASDKDSVAYSVFSRFLLRYGWDEGWALEKAKENTNREGNDSISFFELADYAIDRYSKFAGTIGLSGGKKYNDPLLRMIIAGRSKRLSAGEKVSAPSAPVEVESTLEKPETENPETVYVSWKEGDGGEPSEYYLIRKRKNTGEYLSNLLGVGTSREVYLDDIATKENRMQYYVVAVNGAGVKASTAPAEGWRSSVYIVTLNPVGGSFATESDSVKVVSVAAPLIGELPRPRKPGFEFGGWFWDEKYTLEATETQQMNRDIVLYAKWNSIPKHTVYFKFINRSGQLGYSSYPIEIQHDGFLGKQLLQQLEEELNKINREYHTHSGRTFAGWHEKEGGGGQKATDTTRITEDAEYFEYWTPMTKEYVDSHTYIATASNGDIATAAAMTAANGCRTVGECYALGIDPEDPNDDLKITDFKMEDGKPIITLNHTKDGSGNSFESRIKTLGKAYLTDADWVDVTDKDQSAYRFFKVTVDMP